MIRNVTKALQGLPTKRLVVTDNYYSSITLSQELLKRGFYHVGTYRMNRLGWPAKGVSYDFSTRPKKIPRGTYRIAVNKTTPAITAVSWCDSRSVQLIASGCSTKPTTIRCREKNGTFTDVVCPQLVVDYQKGMGGVDQVSLPCAYTIWIQHNSHLSCGVLYHTARPTSPTSILNPEVSAHAQVLQGRAPRHWTWPS